jgi:WW domain-binding protein 2
MMDFNEAYIRLRERLYQFQEMRREMGPGADVPDEPLPAYEAEDFTGQPQVSSSLLAAPTRGERSDSSASRRAPDEPPPGYDEAQAQQISIRLEDHIRGEVDRGEHDDDEN